jgi:ribulose-phosphate 3-epimerase
MVQIIPTLFATNEEDYKKRIERVLNDPFLAEGWVQLDLMDGRFVPTTGVSLEVVKRNPVPLKKEVQLMVADPDEWIEGLFKVGVDRIVFPLEIDKNIQGLIKKIKDKGVEVGLSINPDTKVESLEPYKDSLDAILLMSVKPGLENQQLDPNTAGKIRYIKDKGWKVKVGVDGGVKDTNVRELVEAGVDYLAIGSYLFNGDIDENIEKIWEALK